MIKILKSQIVVNEKRFNRVNSEFDTITQRKSNNIFENTTIFRKFIEFLYDFAFDMFENSNDNVFAFRKFRYFNQLKTYVIWQNEQHVLTQIKRDMIIKIVAKRTKKFFIVVFTIVEKKSIIKIQKKKRLIFTKKNAKYETYDEYVMKMKQQFDFNNVKHRKNMHVQKIKFVIIFLKQTIKKQWHFHVRTKEFVQFIWQNYKNYLFEKITIDRAIFDQNNYDSWLNVKQLNNYNVSQFIFYLNFLKFYLFVHMQHINFQMINKFKNFVKVKFRTKISNKNFIKKNTTYEKFQNNIIKIEHDFKQKKIY